MAKSEWCWTAILGDTVSQITNTLNQNEGKFDPETVSLMQDKQEIYVALYFGEIF